MTTKTDNQTATAAPEAPTIGPAIRAPRYWTRLLEAARKVEAHSHIDLEANEYHVDVLAMANLCGALGNRKFTKIRS